MPISTIALDRIDEQTCILLGARDRVDTIAVTGVELLLPALAASCVLILGAALVIASRRRRIDEPHSLRGAVLIGIVAALAVTVASVAGPARAEPGQSATGGCDLIDFRNEHVPTDSVIDGSPIEIQRVALRNVTTSDIDVAFSALVDRDDLGLAPFVHVVGNCSCRSEPILDGTMSTETEPANGSAIRLRAEQNVIITLRAATTSSIGDELQGASATYTLVAHARQAAS